MRLTLSWTTKNRVKIVLLMLFIKFCVDLWSLQEFSECFSQRILLYVMVNFMFEAYVLDYTKKKGQAQKALIGINKVFNQFEIFL
jgi:hypothetical protein